jgi:adenine deaminase
MEKRFKNISGNIVDLIKKTIFPGTLEISDGRIVNIIKDSHPYNTFIIPGFVDSHIHIESSLLIPSCFAQIAVTHGTTATVSDPHEIANVMGMEGIWFMIDNSKTVPLKFYFGAPSCVPATPFETSGAILNAEDVHHILAHKDIYGLSEMMNVQGVINRQPDIISRIHSAHELGKPVDGHAPALRGSVLKKYSELGISTDHECIDCDEAEEKIACGMKILIREGSAARNFDSLFPLVNKFPEHCMFCTDDLHPDDLIKGHINSLVKRAIKGGADIVNVLRCASVNPVIHYGLDVGLLQEGDSADFLEVDDLENLNIIRTWINGQIVADEKRALFPLSEVKPVNNFSVKKKSRFSFFFHNTNEKIDIIEVYDGQLITHWLHEVPKVSHNNVISDVSRDILKIAVINRYQDAPPALGFVKNFGLKRGALASSVAHDSHNIVAVAVTDDDLCRAVNLIIEHKGGLALIDGKNEKILPLPIAGIMTADVPQQVADKYAELNEHAKMLGSHLRAPFMTLSFMSLIVIPSLKLSDKGLFDVNKWTFVNKC